jgi:beta-glucuronidase
MGLAIDSAARRRIVADTKELGATLLRAHYPLHPHLHELADREGLLVWSEVPVYGLRTATLKRASVRRAGVDFVRRNVLANNTHPSIVTWSVGNELPPRANRSQADYLRRAERAAKALDRSRPVSYAFQSLPSAGCQRAYGPIDLLGVNEYFGWYPGQDGQLADRSFLPGYLDSLRRCYRGKAMVVSEFGAEANRSGPVEEKGTYEFQQDFVNWHHGVFATKPWLSGVAYWTLREFKVRPEWDGGNPRPNPPMHQKGLISYDGSRKPAFFDVQRLYRGVQQYPGG